MSQLAIRRILAAVKDPTAPVSVAVRKAAQLARGLNAELMLFHAIELPLSADTYATDERRLGDDQSSIRRDYLHALEEQATPLRAAGVAVSVAAEWDFPAAEALLRRAHAEGADLVVIGQAPGSSSHTTVRQILQLSPMPVLLARTAPPYASPALLASMPARARGAAARALEAAIWAHAQAISAALGGSWHLVSTGGRLARALPRPSRKAGAAMRPDIARALPGLGRRPRSTRYLLGPATRTVPQAAAAMHAQMILLGDATASDPLRRLTGDAVRLILERSAQDLLLVKAPGFGIHFSTRIRGPRIVSAGMPPVIWYGDGR